MSHDVLDALKVKNFKNLKILDWLYESSHKFKRSLTSEYLWFYWKQEVNDIIGFPVEDKGVKSCLELRRL